MRHREITIDDASYRVWTPVKNEGEKTIVTHNYAVSRGVTAHLERVGETGETNGYRSTREGHLPSSLGTG